MKNRYHVPLFPSYLTDALGSTEALTNSTGAEQASYTYSAYGAFSINGSTTNSDDYTGRESDGLGLEYFRARYYNPNIGRFLSEDPAGFAGSGPDLYQYAGDDPIDFNDPLGLDRGPGGGKGGCGGGIGVCSSLASSDSSPFDPFAPFGPLDPFDPNDPFNSNSPSAPNNNGSGITWQGVKKAAKWYLCGKSPEDNVKNWMIEGAVKGAVVGAISGGITGTVVGTPVGGVAGAVLGGFVDSVLGATTGVIWGGAASGICYASGAYQ